MTLWVRAAKLKPGELKPGDELRGDERCGDKRCSEGKPSSEAASPARRRSAARRHTKTYDNYFPARLSKDYIDDAMAMKRFVIVIGVAATAAALLAHGFAEARGGKSGGSRSGASRSGGWHSGKAHSGNFRSSGGHFRSHSHARIGGFFVAAPFFGSGYSLYPYYSSYGVPAAEPVYYIEKTDGYWYYCTEAGRYYPDVEQCASPWVPVQGWVATPAP